MSGEDNPFARIFSNFLSEPQVGPPFARTLAEILGAPPRTNPTFGTLAAAILGQRSRAEWNERFVHWERPASETEEAQIERSAGMVRAALATNRWLTAEGVDVGAQGSYYNNTNVRTEADMDLRALHPAIRVHHEAGVIWQEADRVLGYYRTGRQCPDIAAQLRREIGSALTSTFGASNVKPGNKAFRVSGIPGSRAPADVVPALRLDFVYRKTWGIASVLDAVDGIVIYGADGNVTVNFPRQHHENGNAKRLRTRHRYKKVVRTLKRLRDELVERGELPKGVAPSFLIECLVHALDDDVFLHNEDRYARLHNEDRYARVRRALNLLWGLLRNDAWVATAREVNGVKALFAQGQPWTRDSANAFVLAALARTAT